MSAVVPEKFLGKFKLDRDEVNYFFFHIWFHLIPLTSCTL